MYPGYEFYYDLNPYHESERNYHNDDRLFGSWFSSLLFPGQHSGQLPPYGPPPGHGQQWGPPGPPPGHGQQWGPPAPPPGQWQPNVPPGQQAGPPTSPPPSFTPQKSATQQPGLLAVDAGSIRGCMFRYTYVWLTNRQQFWFYPTFVGRRSISGYRWNGWTWVYFGTDLRNIDSFQCI